MAEATVRLQAHMPPMKRANLAWAPKILLKSSCVATTVRTTGGPVLESVRPADCPSQQAPLATLKKIKFPQKSFYAFSVLVQLPAQLHDDLLELLHAGNPITLLASSRFSPFDGLPTFLLEAL